MYQKNPLLQESNVKSFKKLVDKIKKSPNSEKNLQRLKDKLSGKIKQPSLPGFETRSEKKFDIIKRALADKTTKVDNQRKAAKVAYRFLEVR